jgi:enoyl-CoA hydratase
VSAASGTSPPIDPPVLWSIDDGVAAVRMDDGRVNALTPRVIALLNDALDAAAHSARAVAIVGRPGVLCAGFDLPTMRSGRDAASSLVAAGGRLLLRLFAHPQPTVVGVTGHALAAGALLALAGDIRIGGDQPARIGLNETAIGLALPSWATELARARLMSSHLVPAVLHGQVYDMHGAVAAGFLDRVVAAEECEREVFETARQLARLDSNAYAATKQRLWAQTVTAAYSGLQDL